MTDEELRKNLAYLINKYVPENQRDRFYDDISKPDVPVKGILADFNKNKTITVNQMDCDLIIDIYFHFC